MIDGAGVRGQIAGLQIRFQRDARIRGVVDGKASANRVGCMARFHPRPIHAFREQIVTVLAANLRHMLMASARLQLQHTRDRLPGGWLALCDVFDGQIETGQTQRLIIFPHIDVRLGRVICLNVTTTE